MNYLEYSRYKCEVEGSSIIFFTSVSQIVCKELHTLLKFITGNLEDDFRPNEFLIVFRDRFHGGMPAPLLLCVSWSVPTFPY